MKLPTTPRRVATLEPPPLVVDTEPRTNRREASPLLPVTPLLTTRQLDDTDATPTHWRRAARVQRSLMRFAPLVLVGALLTIPKTLDAGVSTLWAKLYGSWWAHAPMGRRVRLASAVARAPSVEGAPPFQWERGRGSGGGRGRVG